jgi:hypothetical protein
MKINIERDDWYPVFIYSEEKDESEYGVDIPQDKYEWIEKTFIEFAKVQDYLEDRFKEEMNK